MATLAVVGAGPKGIATAAKARALSAVGLDSPRVVLIDRSAVAGNDIGILEADLNVLEPGLGQPSQTVGVGRDGRWNNLS